ncbi:MAG: DUF2065 domain-containing protein [Alphaproteobacteria bacterium]|nr:DUF2065 domain-containing protein [Alphaproteobacteria bacterium]
MNEIVTALGLMLLIEGACYALFPDGMKRLLVQMLALPTEYMRTTGLVMALIGFVVIYMTVN